MTDALAENVYAADPPPRLPSGSAQERHGPGWWLFWNRRGNRSYVVQSVAGGRVRVIEYSGLIVPECCKG